MLNFGKKGAADDLPHDARPEQFGSPADLPPHVTTHAETLRADSALTDSIHDQVLMRVEPVVAVQLSRDELTTRVQHMVAQIAGDQRLPLSQAKQEALAIQIVDGMVGLGPLEPLLRD